MMIFSRDFRVDVDRRLVQLADDIDKIEERLRAFDVAGAGGRHEHVLTNLQQRIHSVEESLKTLALHVETCEAMQRKADRDRAQMRHELRGYAATLMVAIVSSFLAVWGHFHGW